MTDLLERVLEHFIGPGSSSCAPGQAGLCTAVRSISPAVISSDASVRATTKLSREGYAHSHCFIALPSRQAIRWLLPLSGGGKSLVQIYTPYAPLARVAKALATTVLALRRRWPRHCVLVASKGALPLEVLVREVTGEHQPIFAMSVGVPNRFHKLSVLVMRPKGEVLGHIKLPLTEAATDRVQHEAAVLDSLWRFPALRPHIPRLLHAGKWGDSYILFQSGGPNKAGPLEFGAAHKKFLETVWSLQEVKIPGQVLVEEVSRRWKKQQSLLGFEWQHLGSAALETASRALNGATVRCSMGHGDFTPWNTRIGNDGLFVFDWEYANWRTPLFWDVLHFHVQVESLLKKKIRCTMPFDQTETMKATFLLYLVNSACQIVEEAPPDDRGLEYRRRVLTEEILREGTGAGREIGGDI